MVLSLLSLLCPVLSFWARQRRLPQPGATETRPCSVVSSTTCGTVSSSFLVGLSKHPPFSRRTGGQTSGDVMGSSESRARSGVSPAAGEEPDELGCPGSILNTMSRRRAGRKSWGYACSLALRAMRKAKSAVGHYQTESTAETNASDHNKIAASRDKRAAGGASSAPATHGQKTALNMFGQELGM